MRRLIMGKSPRDSEGLSLLAGVREVRRSGTSAHEG
jgi:hypothetical protein